jgi:hypothetical protein
MKKALRNFVWIWRKFLLTSLVVFQLLWTLVRTCHFISLFWSLSVFILSYFICWVFVLCLGSGPTSWHITPQTLEQIAQLYDVVIMYCNFQVSSFFLINLIVWNEMKWNFDFVMKQSIESREFSCHSSSSVERIGTINAMDITNLTIDSENNRHSFHSTNKNWKIKLILQFIHNK